MVGLVSLLTLLSVQVASALDTASPASQGMSAELLRQGIVKLRQGHYGDIDSLLVLRRGKLVLEEYLKPDYYGRDYRQPLRSVTKSFASALIGIAIGQRRIRGVEARLPEFFPQYPTVNHPDSRKTEIMLHDLLSMSAGYQWDELIRHYGDPQSVPFAHAQSLCLHRAGVSVDIDHRFTLYSSGIGIRLKASRPAIL